MKYRKIEFKVKARDTKSLTGIVMDTVMALESINYDRPNPVDLVITKYLVALENGEVKLVKPGNITKCFGDEGADPAAVKGHFSID